MSNDATHINICKLMGITYIVYCSGHFSKKAANTFLRRTRAIPFVSALGPTFNLQYIFRSSRTLILLA